MAAAITLRDIVGKALHGFRVGIVPLHGNFDGHAVFFAYGIESLGMQHGFAAVHVFDKAPNPARVGKIFALAVTLVNHLNFHAVIEERQLAQAFSQDIKVKLDQAEGFYGWEEVDFGTLAPCGTGFSQRRNRYTAPELHLVHLAAATYAQTQPV